MFQRILASVLLLSTYAAAQPTSAPTLRLTLQRAIELALQGTAPELALAQASKHVAEARYRTERANALPLFEATGVGQNITRNLNAEGFRFDTGVPGLTIPKSVGPFNTTDLRLSVSQSVFNLAALRREHATQAAIPATQADAERVSDTVARRVAETYAAVLHEAAAVTAGEAALAQARATLESARNRKDAGSGIALDVSRAEYQARHEQQQVAAARGARDRAALALASALGIDLDTPIEFEDAMRLLSAEPSADALASALHSRADLQSARQRERQLQLSAEAIDLERLPTLSAYADAGALGGIETHTIALSIRIPVFDAGRRRSREAEVSAMLQQEQAREKQLRRDIELQLRQAEIDLRVAAGEVESAESYIALAENELAQARRRHDAGAGGLPDVIEAQTRLAAAVRSRVDALFRYTNARIESAYSSGSIRQFSL
jgi:outer membrane protein